MHKCNNFVTNRGGDEHNYSLSLIRFTALLMIITCHILQYENNFLAFWFNVGVQIFLCLSGFIYGQRSVGDVTRFFARRFKKILFPYYIVIIVVSFVLFVISRESLSFPCFVGNLLLRTVIAGGEHLWFIPVILFCYVITPFLEAYRERYVKNTKTFLLLAAICVVTVSVFCGLFADFFNPAWISCYVIGYAVGMNSDKDYIKEQIIIVAVFLITIIGHCIQFFCGRIPGIELTGIIATAYGYFLNYNHVWLGVLIFLIMNFIFERIRFDKKLCSVLDITDKYSYEVYLVHQFLILGPLSLMALTPIMPLNILIILIGIMLLAFLLKIIEGMVAKK